MFLAHVPVGKDSSSSWGFFYTSSDMTDQQALEQNL